MSEKRILIIDDDEDLSFIISDMLEGYGYHVTCVADGSHSGYGSGYLLLCVCISCFA